MREKLEQNAQKRKSSSIKYTLHITHICLVSLTQIFRLLFSFSGYVAVLPISAVAFRKRLAVFMTIFGLANAGSIRFALTPARTNIVNHNNNNAY